MKIWWSCDVHVHDGLWNCILPWCKLICFLHYDLKFKVKLDDNIATDEQVVALVHVLDELYAKACIENDPTGQAIVNYLCAALSFEDGNASRPAVINNVTIAEYTALHTVYNISVQCGSVPPLLRVREHKTKACGAACCTVVCCTVVN